MYIYIFPTGYSPLAIPYWLFPSAWRSACRRGPLLLPLPKRRSQLRSIQLGFAAGFLSRFDLLVAFRSLYFRHPTADRIWGRRS